MNNWYICWFFTNINGSFPMPNYHVTKVYGGVQIYSSMLSETQHQIVVKCQLHAS
jgi:hypothetical protein